MSLPAIFHGPRRALLVRLVANGAVQAAATVATALVVRHLFDELLSQGGQVGGRSLGVAAAFVALTAVAMAWLRVLERTDAERLGQDYVARVRLRVFDHLSRLSLRAQRQRGRGALMLRFVTDLNGVRQWVSRGLARFIVAGIAASGGLGALIYLNPALAAATAAALTCCGLAAYSAGGVLRARVMESRRRRAHIATNIGDKLSALAVVQACGQVRRERKRIRRQSRRLGDAMVARAQVTGFVRSLPDMAVALATVAILVVGAWQVGSGDATPGTLVAGIIILGVLARPLRDLSRIFVYWHNFQVSRQKLNAFMKNAAIVREARDARPLSPGPGRLVFDRVSVAGGPEAVSVTAEPGSLVALTGPSGAGKSTILALAARLLDPVAGRVLLDDQDIASVTLESLRREVGIVSPDIPLLRGSVGWNIRYRCPKASDGDVARVLDLCELTADIANLSDGEKTRIVEGGMDLPNGLRQRIAIARALLGEPRLLLLDDPDATLDPKGRRVLGRILAERRATTLIVTHDTARVAAADAVWYLDQGGLLDQGPGGGVLEGDGPAARFFRGTGEAQPQDRLVLVSSNKG
ncbi:MAG: ABC transporter ATP-binding protein [Rhodospirillales bacterium]